jgi:hypothetical protein
MAKIITSFGTRQNGWKYFFDFVSPRATDCNEFYRGHAGDRHFWYAATLSLGMERLFGGDGIQILEMPTGRKADWASVVKLRIAPAD